MMFALKPSIYRGFSMAMLNNQMVFLTFLCSKVGLSGIADVDLSQGHCAVHVEDLLFRGGKTLGSSWIILDHSCCLPHVSHKTPAIGLIPGHPNWQLLSASSEISKHPKHPSIQWSLSLNYIEWFGFLILACRMPQKHPERHAQLSVASVCWGTNRVSVKVIRIGTCRAGTRSSIVFLIPLIPVE